MRRVSNEPRQVRKEAAVVRRSVCCGVPDLFWFLNKPVKSFFLLPDGNNKQKKSMPDSSYQVIARRWRPKQFSELVGQDHVVKTWETQ